MRTPFRVLPAHGEREAAAQSFYDAEARVAGYEPGKGRNKGATGALRCVMASGKVSGLYVPGALPV